MQKRVIPLLLLHDGGLYKTVKFKNPSYIGDPINVIKIFNEKEVDELVILDIDAARNRSAPDLELLRSMVDECFCPLAYGGGVASNDHVRQLINLGIEKVVINTAACEMPGLIESISNEFGRSTVVGSIDYTTSLLGKRKVVTRGGQGSTTHDLLTWAKELDRRGVGEILLTAVDLDGMMKGYDLDTLRKVVEAVNVPVVAAGGAGSFEDIKKAISQSGAAAAAAGSMFVYQGRHRAVLVTYPSQQERAQLLG